MQFAQKKRRIRRSLPHCPISPDKGRAQASGAGLPNR